MDLADASLLLLAELTAIIDILTVDREDSIFTALRRARLQ